MPLLAWLSTPHPSSSIGREYSTLFQAISDLSLVLFVDHGPKSPVSRSSTTDPDCFSGKLRHD